jgi:hypothetical protein
MMTSETPMAVARHETPAGAGLEPLRVVPVWNGILHEFRNHLTVLLAAATEIRLAAPPPAAREIGDALTETEWNVERLNALVGFVDAALRDGTTVVADLDDVIERAMRLAAPTLGRASVSFVKNRRTGIANRGSALESLLAALLVELCRADKAGADEERRLQIEIHADVARGAIVLEIESNGRRPPPESWRYVLAADLAARLGASVVTLPDTAGYLIRFS